MLKRSFLALLGAAPLALSALCAQAETPQVSPLAPATHENLAVYFLTSAAPSAKEAPLTLAEALEAGVVKVAETGQVSELKIENTGDKPVFVHAGDIVKGGKQDRMITTSLLLPAKSGETPLAAFCVEQGRWAQRGGEDVAQFSAAKEMAPLKAVRSALASYGAPDHTPEQMVQSRLTAGADRQSQVWASVGQTQHKLAQAIIAKTRADASPTSLQLSLESDGLAKARAPYIEALEARGLEVENAVGFLYAVNGEIQGGEMYETPALFQKLWPKLLRAATTDALAEKDALDKKTAPPIEAAAAFLSEEGAEKLDQRTLPAQLELRETKLKEAIVTETRRAGGETLHKTYLTY